MELIKITRCYDVAGQRKKFGMFICSVCNNEVERRLQHGKIQKTCGCGKHGGTGDDLYKVWAGIKRRCYNKHEAKYHRYGGRGIEVCAEWQNNYPNFKEWANSNGYKKGLQIDRRDNDKHYAPDNCRFVTNTENARNKSQTILSMKFARVIRNIFNGLHLTYKEIGDIFSVDSSIVRQVVLNRIWKEEATI